MKEPVTTVAGFVLLLAIGAALLEGYPIRIVPLGALATLLAGLLLGEYLGRTRRQH